MAELSRQQFLKTLGRVGAVITAGGALLPSAWADGQTDPILAGRPLVRYPEKIELLLLTSRPPQLETPMTYFDGAITPNEAFFVRYRIFPIPTSIDLSTRRLQVTGLVDKPLALSKVAIEKYFLATRRRGFV